MAEPSETSEKRSDLPPYAVSAVEVMAAQGSSTHGLSRAETASRLETYGRNVLPQPPAPGIATIFLRQFLSPLIYVLLIAALVSLLLQEWMDALFIFAVLIINAIIGAVQEFHANRSAEALRKMVVTKAQVLREGESFEIDSEELVVGDIVMLEPGGKVPADIRLIDAHGLEIDESLLTGESVAVAKDAGAVMAADAAMADCLNMAYSGTMTSRGRGRGIITAVASRTEVGQLAESLAYREGAKPPLLQRMHKFTIRIGLALAVAVAVLASIELMRGVPWQEIFLVSVALAVSVIPEGLPVAVTVTLAIGMNRMARRHVIVRRLVAVEALGSCTVIASDKTGTLTLNELTARNIAIPGQQPWDVTGEGAIPEGMIVSRTGTLSGDEERQLERLCLAAVLCNEGFLGRRDDSWASHGDAVDVALLVMAHKANVTRVEALNRFPLLAEIPYESERGFAASLHEAGEGAAIFVKGATERLLQMCTTMATAEGESALDASVIEAKANALAENGFRVLAFASGRRPDHPGHGFSEEHLYGLRLLGLVGLIDPLRTEAKAAVAACRQAGIRACMITGDHPLTAFAIARELDMAQDKAQLVHGSALREVEHDEVAVDALVAGANVFARVAPEQKLAIVRSFERRGEFIAVTGDGANDAPALNAANVGVAMGMRGTDVARESADIVITDDHFASIVAGVEEGRVAYQNIRKVIFLLISTGAAELVLFMLALITGLPLPLHAAQLLWLNLVTNGIQDVALAFEPREGHEMRRPPRQPQETIFNRLMLERTVVSALVIGSLAFTLFFSLLNSGMAVEDARNSTLLLMVLFENVHAFNSRSETISAFGHNPMHNPLLLFGTAAAQAVHIGAMYTPGLSSVLGIHPVSLAHWASLLPVALIILLTMEAHKWHWRIRARGRQAAL